ncbi:MAG TPA: FecR family protein [Polyangiaceae bacterium]
MRAGGDTSSAVRALKQVAREAVGQAIPEPDWSHLERRILHGIDREGRVMPSQRRWQWVAAGLAAAALCLAVFIQHANPGASRVAKTSGKAQVLPAGRRDGDELASSGRVVAADQSVEVEHRGRATWTLEPNSKASVRSVGERITVQLHRGALVARVVPSPLAESFAVEVEQTRVAVHGTVFRVEREADSVMVEVREGTVVVGAVSSTGGHAWPLSAPSRGRFSLDGVLRSAAANVKPSESAQATAQPSATVPSSVRAPPVYALPSTPSSARASGKPAAASEPTPAVLAEGQERLQERPTIGQIEDGMSAFLSIANRCLAERTQSSGSVQVSVSSTVVLTVTPQGNVTRMQFNPPLAPPVSACIASRIGGVSMAPSRRGATITRAIELRR